MYGTKITQERLHRSISNFKLHFKLKNIEHVCYRNINFNIFMLKFINLFLPRDEDWKPLQQIPVDIKNLLAPTIE